jgi:2-enoate reductase
MTTSFRNLFKPIQIGSVEIKNRIAMAPMGILGLVNSDGSPGPRAIDYYVERAKGGVGLIITGIFRVNSEMELFHPGIPIVTRACIAPFGELAEVLHSLGTKIFVQLTAGLGRVAHPQKLISDPISASSIPNYWIPEKICRALSTEEVEKLAKSFGDAAEILAAAGIDGVELHGHEGYLFDQFATAIWNKRNDKYGGDLRARLRFILEVLRSIKEKAGANFPVQYRFGLKHYIKDLHSAALPGEKYKEAGRDIEEGIEMAMILADAGFDSLHVDAGCYDSWYWPHPPIYQDYGCLIDMAAQVKKRVNIPIIGVGKMGVPELAESAIADGKADIIALGKSLLADAFWVKKAAQGRTESIRPCIGCHDGCMGRVIRGKPLSCAVNPATGRERSYAIESTNNPRKVMIVGGGVSGMEAARVAAMRGHSVTLFERNDSLGGHLIEGSIPQFKKDIARLLEWYKRELKNARLDIKIGTEVNLSTIELEKPDVVIIATGSKPIIPQIPGLFSDNTVTAIDVFLGKKLLGERVIVLGGGVIGCEAGLWLAQQGKEVIIIELLPDILMAGIPIQHMNRLMLLDLLRFNEIRIMTNTSAINFENGNLILSDNGNKSREQLWAEDIVLAVGLQADQVLYKSLRSKIPDLFLIGDARHPQNILNAIWDAFHVAQII